MNKPFQIIAILLLFPALSFSQVWTQLGADLDGEFDGDRFGQSISLTPDGTTLAVGAPYNSGSSSTGSGHVRVFRLESGSWVQLGGDIEESFVGAEFGRSVSLSADGNTVAIGADDHSVGGSRPGMVRVFTWDDIAWLQKGADLYGERTNDSYGVAVSLSADGDILAVGALGHDGSGENAGQVQIYNWDSIAWVLMGSDLNGEGEWDRFGSRLDLSADGTIVAVGAYGNEGAYVNTGHVRIYSWSGAYWTMLGEEIEGQIIYEGLGHSVSLSDDGTIVAIGSLSSYGVNENTGHVEVYEWNGVSWIQRGSDLVGEVTDDRFGISNSLSADGNTLAIGGSLNDGTGVDAGHVRVFKWNGTAWVQWGPDIDGENKGDNSGVSVSLSADGSTIAIGADLNSMFGAVYGHVRVYEFDTQTSVQSNILEDALVFPNPSTGIVNIELGNLNDVSIKVFSESGQLIYQEVNINSSLYQFELVGAVGVYIVEVDANGKKQEVKLIKE